MVDYALDSKGFADALVASDEYPDTVGALDVLESAHCNLPGVFDADLVKGLTVFAMKYSDEDFPSNKLKQRAVRLLHTLFVKEYMHAQTAAETIIKSDKPNSNCLSVIKAIVTLYSDFNKELFSITSSFPVSSAPDCYEALAIMAQGTPELVTETIKIIQKGLDDDNYVVRINALKGLALLGPEYPEYMDATLVQKATELCVFDKEIRRSDVVHAQGRKTLVAVLGKRKDLAAGCMVKIDKIEKQRRLGFGKKMAVFNILFEANPDILTPSIVSDLSCEALHYTAFSSSYDEARGTLVLALSRLPKEKRGGYVRTVLSAIGVASRRQFRAEQSLAQGLLGALLKRCPEIMQDALPLAERGLCGDGGDVTQKQALTNMALIAQNKSSLGILVAASIRKAFPEGQTGSCEYEARKALRDIAFGGPQAAVQVYPDRPLLRYVAELKMAISSHGAGSQ